MESPRRMTITRLPGSEFEITAELYSRREIRTTGPLTFDEMLGCVAHSFCPGDDRPGPAGFLNTPLFLEPPKPPHPDAAGDAAPVVPKRQPDWPSLSQWRSTGDTIVAVAMATSVIEDAISDALRLAITHGKTVFLEFNGSHHAISPKQIINGIADDKIPF